MATGWNLNYTTIDNISTTYIRICRQRDEISLLSPCSWQTLTAQSKRIGVKKDLEVYFSRYCKALSGSLVPLKVTGMQILYLKCFFFFLQILFR